MNNGQALPTPLLLLDAAPHPTFRGMRMGFKLKVRRVPPAPLPPASPVLSLVDHGHFLVPSDGAAFPGMGMFEIPARTGAD